jgi:hypothetical protein
LRPNIIRKEFAAARDASQISERDCNTGIPSGALVRAGLFVVADDSALLQKMSDIMT